MTNSKSDYQSDFPPLVLNISLILEWVASLADPGWARRGGCHRNIGCLDDLLAVFLFLDHFIGEVDILDIEYPQTFLINVCTATILEVGKVTENIYFSKI